MASTIDDALASQVERFAERNPRAYRLRLTVLAMLGNTGYTFVLLLPVALTLGIGALWFNQVWVYGLAGACVLGAWWLMQDSDEVPGRELRRTEAPRLFEELDRLSVEMRAPFIDRVVLDETLNAAAVEETGRLNPFRSRRTLLLGVPLLAALDAAAFKAVLAHELAHFSRHFGWHGHWIYRSRAGWLRFHGRVDREDAILFQAATRFAQWFVPYFSAYSLAHSRRCEYEADALAARAVGENALARGLAGLRASAHRLQALERDFDRLLAKDAKPPDDRYERLQHAIVAGECPLLSQLLDETASAEDTHPLLRQRLHALNVDANEVLLARDGRSVGEAWCGDGWRTLLDEFSTRWAAERRRSWACRHEWLAACRLKRQDSSASLAQQLEMAAALGEAQPLPRPLPGIDDVDAVTRFRVGVSLLQRGEFAIAVQWLQAAVAAQPAIAAPARRWLEEAQLIAVDRQRNAALLERARERRQAARELAWEEVERDLGTVRIEPWRCDVLLRALARDEAIETAVLGAREARLPGDRLFVVHTLCLRVRVAPGVDEQAIATDYQDLLSLLAPPHEVSLVRTWWDTEPWPAPLRDAAPVSRLR